jgi:hypothetical protein
MATMPATYPRRKLTATAPTKLGTNGDLIKARGIIRIGVVAELI